MEKMRNNVISNPMDLSASHSLSEEEEIYKENIIDYYKNPRNKRKLEDFDISEEGHNPLCGDKIKIYLKIGEICGRGDDLRTRKIEDVSFTGDGCAISQAAVSMLTEELVGKEIKYVKGMEEKNVHELLGIKISHTRRKCANLGLKTIQKALILVEEKI